MPTSSVPRTRKILAVVLGCAAAILAMFLFLGGPMASRPILPVAKEHPESIAAPTASRHPDESASRILPEGSSALAALAVLKVSDSRGLQLDGVQVSDAVDNRALSIGGIDGMAEIPLDLSAKKRSVVASKRGFVGALVEVSLGEVVNVVLQDAHSLRLVCKHRDESIAAGVKCRVIRQQDSTAPQWRSDTRQSGADGAMVFEGLREGRYEMLVEDPSLVPVSFSGATRSGVAAVPDIAEVAITVAQLSAICVQVSGDEVVSGFFRVGISPAFASPGSGDRASAAQEMIKQKFPGALTRVWVAARPDQEVEWVGYLRFTGWTSFRVRPRTWSGSMTPEVHIASPGKTDLTASISVDWGGGSGVPMVARLQDTDHGIVAIELRDNPVRVPLGSYLVVPADASLRRYVQLESESAVDLTRSASSWAVRATLREPLDVVTCCPRYQPAPGQSEAALSGTLEVLDGDVMIGQHYCDGATPIRLWVPRGRDLTWRCSLQSAFGNRLVSAQESSAAAVGGHLSLLLK